MIRISSFLIFINISFMLLGQSAYVDPVLFKSVAEDVEAIILFKQADISGAKTLKTKNAKALYVYQTLIKATDVQQEIKSILDSEGISYQSYYIINGIYAKLPQKLIRRIADHTTVESILHNSPMKMHEPIFDRYQEGSRTIEWGISKIKADSVWLMGYEGSNVIIGGQDTGYEWDHPALKNQYRGWNGVDSMHNYNWHDAITAIDPHNTGANPCNLNIPYPCDDNNHGTHTMGTMAGDDGNTNQIGVAPGAKWIGCRNMERGWGTPATYLECFEWFLAPYPFENPSMADPNMMPHVINNSWGCPTNEGCNTSNFGVMNTAVNNLRAAGCVVVVSAGNSGSSCNTVNTPAAIYEGSFSVGATQSNDAIASFSSRGAVTVDGSNRLKPNISAPGVGVRSSVRPPALYSSFSGTSMAGPHVAGVVALLISSNTLLEGQVELIEYILEQTAVHLTSTQNCSGVLGTSIPNNTFGYGRIDALAAVQMASVSSYSPFVITPSHIIISPANGLILRNKANQNYKITVADNGALSHSFVTSIASGSNILRQSSLSVDNQTGGIVLTSPNGTLYKLVVDVNGLLATTSITNITKYIQIQGDLHIDGGTKGILLKNNTDCYLVNVTTLGNIIVIPTICP